MSCVLVIGAQYGDEGKGKVVDLFSEKFDIVARYQGGHNAGHTIVVGGRKIVLNAIPSGVLRNKVCILGNGMVICPKNFEVEIASLRAHGMPTNQIFVSSQAHLIAPWHVAIENQRGQVGSSGIGTTGMGIGPTYEDKARRSGIRVGDILRSDFVVKAFENFKAVTGKVPQEWSGTGFDDFVTNSFDMMPHICDTVGLLHSLLQDGEMLLIEGAQGTNLDIDHGSYPFVTSSSTIAGGACTGLGIPPRFIDCTIGVAKAYTTRVGCGPFVTQMEGELAELVQKKGNEFGSRTGRARRPGWLDLVQMRRAAMINGFDGLVITKADVLAGLVQNVQVCTGYTKTSGDMGDYPVSAWELSECLPIYREFKGWGDLRGVTRYDDLDGNFRRFLEFIEEFTGVPVVGVSVGEERHQTIIRKSLDPSLFWLNGIDVTA